MLRDCWVYSVWVGCGKGEWVYQYVNPQQAEWPTTIIAESNGNIHTTGLISVAETSGIGIIKFYTVRGQ